MQHVRNALAVRLPAAALAEARRIPGVRGIRPYYSIDELCNETWDLVVLDEAQAIKNSGSQTARAAFELKGKFRVALSGTPVENRLEELWSVMHFANPGLLGGRRLCKCCRRTSRSHRRRHRGRGGGRRRRRRP